MNNNIITWPIARFERKNLCLIGIPQRLGDGKPYSKDTYDTFPHLEEVIGEAWEEKILSILLPSDRCWAWWTTTSVFNQTDLANYPKAKLPKRFDLTRPPAKLCTQRFIFRGQILVVSSLNEREIQDKIIKWAGWDTETNFDFLWVAPDQTQIWDIQVIKQWCGSKEKWDDLETVIPSNAQRIIGWFDGDIYCVLPNKETEMLISGIRTLADSWNLSIIPGPKEYSWLSNVIK